MNLPSITHLPGACIAEIKIVAFVDLHAHLTCRATMPEPEGDHLIVLGAPNADQKIEFGGTAFTNQEVINILYRIQWPRVNGIQLELVAVPVGMQGVVLECIAHPSILLG